MVLDIGIKGLVQFIEFEAITVFGFFVLLNLEKLMQYFVSSILKSVDHIHAVFIHLGQQLNIYRGT